MNHIQRVEDLLRQMPPESVWMAARQSILTKGDGFDLHEAVYKLCRDAAIDKNVPFSAWQPSEEGIAGANVTQAASQVGCSDYPDLYRWSITDRASYWALVAERLGIFFRKPFSHVLDMKTPTQPVWFSGARMNIVDSCFAADPSATAILFTDLSGVIRPMTYGELHRQVGRIANGLFASGVSPGDCVALLLPMSPDAVALYLAIIAVGGVVVAIAESFAPAEIATRMQLAAASLVFTQETMTRGGKNFGLYEKIVSANAPRAIIMPSIPAENVLLRRPQDRAWKEFLSDQEDFEAAARSPQDTLSILFSSGTTGEPKAIPWDHTTPIKCAADAHFHQDIHSGDVLCWPTSLGWMMGPWLLFAALLNRSTLALYTESPSEAGFGEFVQDASVTMLGLVPSLVRSWRLSGCMEKWDWSAIRVFSSSGECSNASDMLYLMFLADYAPVIEYCGGTEIGGAYCTGTVVQPCVPATFTTAALGIELQIFDEYHRLDTCGEVFLRGPSVGLSTWLLAGDHEAIYFQDVPESDTVHSWRKHGDEMEMILDGRTRMLGRCDDTMNLGGIKVSCIEIEQLLNQHPDVLETAAIAVSPEGGGPSKLVIYAVLPAGSEMLAADLKKFFQLAIRKHLNPLFQIAEVRLISALPRTASNKVVRRTLREKPLSE